MEKKITLSSVAAAEQYKIIANVEGEITQNKEGEVLLAYDDKCPTAKASIDDETFERRLGYIYDTIREEVQWISRRIDNVYKALAEHQVGHLPCVKSAEQLEKAIKALGLANEYEVEKTKIRINRDKGYTEAYLD